MTDPAGEEGAVLELAQVESDEVGSRHEQQGQQRRVGLSHHLPSGPGGRRRGVTPRGCCVVSMVTALERMLLKDLERQRHQAQIRPAECGTKLIPRLQRRLLT